jgi:four helix bundle suffix protein
VPGSAELAANAALSLLNLATHLLDRQIATLEAAFVKDGGLRERMTRARLAERANKP